MGMINGQQATMADLSVHSGRKPGLHKEAGLFDFYCIGLSRLLKVDRR
jgi:hypothetical protein